jgi:RNA polymerase sigma-70 factor (ECF subfamily)
MGSIPKRRADLQQPATACNTCNRCNIDRDRRASPVNSRISRVARRLRWVLSERREHSSMSRLQAPAAAMDAALLERIAGGDMGAVATLYDRYASALLGVALRIVRDRAEAEDVVHDAFIVVSHRAGQYAPERGTVAAWMLTLTRNLAIDRTRRRDRQRDLTNEVLAHEPAEKPKGPDALAADEVERDKGRRALASLPSQQRTTLEVAFFEGLSYPEIAEREKVPLGTIKSRAARALGALRLSLAKEGLNGCA